jgi:hypothetical protein
MTRSISSESARGGDSSFWRDRPTFVTGGTMVDPTTAPPDGIIHKVLIGLETHAQLSTASKIFSGAATQFGAAPNVQACAVDIALPGVLPVANRGAVERAIRFGLAVGGTINKRSVFARKNYFYPDLPKGYQISQYDKPLAEHGFIEIPVAGDQQRGRAEVDRSGHVQWLQRDRRRHQPDREQHDGRQQQDP